MQTEQTTTGHQSDTEMTAIHVKVPDWVHSFIDEEAKRLGEGKSVVARMIIREGISRLKASANA